MECAREFKARWQAPGQAWLGHVIGLSPSSLRYPTPGVELGFVMNLSGRLCRVWYICMIFYVLVMGFWMVFLMDYPGDSSDPAYPVKLTQFATRGVCVSMGLVHLLVMSVPRLYKAVNVSLREKAVVVLVTYTQLIGYDKYYVAKLYGFSDPVEIFPDLEGYTDSIVLLFFMTYLVVAHFLPVRWFLLAAMQILAVAMYGACVFVLGSPEPRGKMCFAHLFFIVLLVSLAKRQSEVNERLVFSAFLAEKSLRMQAEFELSRVGPHKEQGKAGSEDEDQASITSTTATREAFTGLDSAADSSSCLETIWEIGKKEQWLISEHELVAHPHICLGSGGFGVVIDGEFQGSPVALKLQIKTGRALPLLDIGNELRLMRKLRHPNIVLFHGACLSIRNNDLILVMEHVIGDSMLEFISRNPPTESRSKALMDICHALRYLHSRHPPITHCDLKPANIMVEGRREGIHAKLLDFGLARLLTRKTKPGGGTYRWMAPGVLRANGAVRLEDDVYAFGLVMYFASTSQLPFKALGDRTLKAYATGQDGASPTLDWPRDMTDLATQCKPIVDRCTHAFGAERFLMEQVHANLRCLRDKSTRSPALAGGMDESHLSSGDSTQADLWSKLHLARHIAMQRSKLKKKLPQLTKLQKEQSVTATSRQLASVPEQDSVNDSNSSGPTSSTRYPSLGPTPTYTMVASLIDTMSTWNVDMAAECCCEFHASVHQTRSLCKLLAGRDCAQLRMAGMRVYQCPSCQMLINDEEGALEELDCHGCGYEGPPGASVMT